MPYIKSTDIHEFMKSSLRISFPAACFFLIFLRFSLSGHPGPHGRDLGESPCCSESGKGGFAAGGEPRCGTEGWLSTHIAPNIVDASRNPTSTDPPDTILLVVGHLSIPILLRWKWILGGSWGFLKNQQYQAVMMPCRRREHTWTQEAEKKMPRSDRWKMNAPRCLDCSRFGAIYIQTLQFQLRCLHWKSSRI